MRGREWGGEERMEATVDFPVAIEPVSPIMSISFFFSPLALRNRRYSLHLQAGSLVTSGTFMSRDCKHPTSRLRYARCNCW